MNTQIQNILSQATTKTHKIQQLILLGLSRTQIAGLVTNGNYGFVQNVYAKMQREGTLNQAAIVAAIIEEAMTPRAFDKEFGVEFEAYNVDKTVLCNRLREAGINCETEGYNHNTRSHWKIVSDGSLRGNQTFELVSPILKGEAGIVEMMKVCNVLNKCGAKVNQTCGTHVHLNASGFSLDQWKRIYINYGRLEKVIDGFMPESRRANNNTYCKGFTEVTNFENKIKTAQDLHQIENLLLNSRYWKVNPQSYSRHRTCEFRQHAGTTDFVKISSWIRFLSNLVDYSEQYEVATRTLATLKNFNSMELVNYFEYRTLELAA
ncbi:MAG: amidoligase family protein [Prevotellaceae bacterium]|jgi:hypothetical protein|nr:amidoligase family protein [Prevotellaceae bacterium]